MQDNKSGGFFDSLLDFNGDGKTDFTDTVILAAILNEMDNRRREKREQSAYDPTEKIVDLDDMDIKGI